MGDFEAPNITNCPTSMVVGTDALVSTYFLDWTPNITDNSDPSPTFSVASFPTPGLGVQSNFPLGFTRVTLTARDNENNVARCTFDVTVEDREEPRVTCSDYSFVTPLGATSMIVSFSPPTATDNVGLRNQSLTPSINSGATLSVGSYAYTFVVEDTSGNDRTCTMNILVSSQPVSKTSTDNTSTGIVGGVAVLVLIAIVLLVFLVYRRYKQRIANMEEELRFRENEEWVLARAQAIAAGAAHRSAAPLARDLDLAMPTRALNAPPADLLDLYDLNMYMPYESVARELERDRVILDYEIGSGEFGSVWAGRILLPDDTERPTAVKMLKESAGSDSMVGFKQEIAIVGQLDHPKVVSLLGYVTKSEPILMCLEFLEFGNLKGYLSEPSVKARATQRDLIMMALDVANGMHYVGTMGLVHRDLAARNVLINKRLECKVADFGLCVEMLNGEDHVVIQDATERIPVRWTAMEALNNGRWSSLSDVWSFGVVVSTFFCLFVF